MKERKVYTIFDPPKWMRPLIPLWFVFCILMVPVIMITEWWKGR